MSAYYNEIDPYAAAWLRNLIAAGHIAPGDVDARSIVDVRPDDLRGYTRCHFFAGIAGWDLALQLAGWPDEREVWTGSCPCQPLSSAGKRRGHVDERHLWPAFYRLIAECRPATVFGEQVASRDGREWLAGVRADMEGLGYAVGAADLCAASVGAPHIRQRLWWVADLSSDRRGENDGALDRASRSGKSSGHLAGSGSFGGLADDDRQGRGELAQRDSRPDAGGKIQRWPDLDRRGDVGGVGDTGSAGSGRDDRAIPGAQGEGQGERRASRRLADESVAAGDASRMGNSDESGSQGRGGGRNGADERPPWSSSVALECADGKTRRVEPSIFPLAHAGEWGVGSRVGILCAAGNAIVPALAAEFVIAAMEALA